MIRKQTRYVIAIGARYLLLRLYHFQRGGDTRAKTIAGLRESVVRQAAALFRQMHLAAGGLHLNQCGADILLHFAALVC